MLLRKMGPRFQCTYDVNCRIFDVLALQVLDLLLKAESVKDHDVGAIEDEGEEEREAGEVRVTLRAADT